MAPLTWKNVEAPEFSSAAQMYSMAGQGLSSGFGGIGDALKGVREAQRNQRSAAAIPMLAKIANEQGAGAAVDWVSQNVRPEDMTPGLQEALLGANTKGLGLDVTRSGMTRANAENTRTQTTWDRGIARENQLAALTLPYAQNQENAYWGNAGEGQPPGTEPGGQASGMPPYNTRTLMAMNIAAEAGGESIDGKRAVGAVVMNRAKDGRYGEGIHGVITKRGQFSWTNAMTGYAGGEGGIPVDQIKPSAEDYAVADEILNGVASGEGYIDPTGGATHYANLKHADPNWGPKAGGEWLTIGNHTFGSPDGPGRSANPNLSAYIQKEGNLLTPSDVGGLNDELYADQRTAKSDRETDQASEDSKAALVIAQTAITNSDRPQDVVPSIMNDPNLSAQVKKQAIAEAQGMDYAAMTAAPFGSAITLRPEAQAAVDASIGAYDDFVSVNGLEAAQSEPERLYKKMTEAYGDGDPAGALAKTIGVTNDPESVGYLTSHINRVRDALVQPDGSKPSPAMAAVLVEETLRRGGWLPGDTFDGDVADLVGDWKDAVELGKKNGVGDADKTRLIAQEVTKRERKSKELETLASQQAELMAVIKRRQDRGQDTKGLEEQLIAVSGQISAMAPGRGALPEAPVAGGAKGGSGGNAKKTTPADAPYTPTRARELDPPPTLDTMPSFAVSPDERRAQQEEAAKIRRYLESVTSPAP